MTVKTLDGVSVAVPQLGHTGKFGRQYTANCCVKSLLANRFEFRDGGPERHPCEGGHVRVLRHLVEHADRIRGSHGHAELGVLKHGHGILDYLPDVSRGDVRVRYLLKASARLRQLSVVLLLFLDFGAQIVTPWSLFRRLRLGGYVAFPWTEFVASW